MIPDFGSLNVSEDRAVYILIDVVNNFSKRR
jgi:hypothetical protein